MALVKVCREGRSKEWPFQGEDPLGRWDGRGTSGHC